MQQNKETQPGVGIAPDQVGDEFQRAAEFHRRGQLHEAADLYQKILRSVPDHFDALHLLGVIEAQKNNYGAAVDLISKALTVNPEAAAAHSNLGNVLLGLMRLEDALASYDRALALRPAHPETLERRGNVLFALNRYEEAAGCYEKLIEAAPDYPYAPGNFLSSKCYACDWRGYDAARQSVVRGIEEGKVAASPATLIAVLDSPAGQLKCAQAHVRRDHPPSSNPLWRGERYRHDRIRVAYVSADFHVHPTAFLMLGLFERHDHTRFETIAISYGPDQPGPMRTRIEGAFDRFINARGRSPLEIAKMMRELEVDIAIDCKGFTKGARPEIFACRPAPVQAQYLAYPGTMGADYIDYILPTGS